MIIGIAVLIGILLYSLPIKNISEQIKALTIKNHTIAYDGISFTPEFVVIHLGDSITIKNNSQKAMEIAVGLHENHKTLNGFQEKIINSKKEYAFVPQERGVFDLHDHFNPKKLGYIIIDK